MNPKEYLKDFKSYNCLVHPWFDATGHHFPQGRRRTDALYKQIPLCQGCHTDGQYSIHRDAFTFLRENGLKVIMYFSYLMPKNNKCKKLVKEAVDLFYEDYSRFYSERVPTFDKFWEMIMED